MNPAVTIGGGHLYVVTSPDIYGYASSGGPSYGGGIYQYSTGEGCPQNPTAPAGTLCRFAWHQSSLPSYPDTWRPTGVTYYRGKLYVSTIPHDAAPEPEGALRDLRLKAKVDIYNAIDLQQTGTFKTPALNGIDAAWGELWGRVSDVGANAGLAGVSLDYFAILDINTGALRGIVPIGLNPNPRWGGAPFGDGPPVGSSCVNGDCWAYFDPWEFAKDVAISPELNIISSGDVSIRRLTNNALVSGDPTGWYAGTFASTGPLFSTINGDPGCAYAAPYEYNRDSPVGAYAPWGMRWLIQIDSHCRSRRPTAPPRETTVVESPLTYAWTTGIQTGVARGAGREWKPRDQTTYAYDRPVVRDIAYQAHEPRISWTGKPTENAWQHGNQTLTYFVSDGEFYTVANNIERWLDPANGFQNIVLTATPTTADGQPNGSPIQLATSTNWQGTLTINEDTLPSGTYRLTMTATIGGGKTVTKTNPSFRVDHTPPNGTLDNLPYATAGTVAISGTMADAHSGPSSWRAQGNGAEICTRTAPSAETGKYECQWNTLSWPENAYDVRTVLSDAVQPAYGGSNTQASALAGNGRVFVDRTAPSISLSGDFYDRRDGEMIWGDETPYLNIAATDGWPGSGVRSIEVTVDGQRQDYAEYGCSTGGCGQTRAYTFPPSSVTDGTHSVEVITVDHANNRSVSRWTVLVKPTGADGHGNGYDPTADSADPADADAADSPGADTAADESGMNGDYGGASYYSSSELQCSPTDPYVVHNHVDYAPPLLGGSLGFEPTVPTAQAALMQYLEAAVTLPRMPFSAFTPASDGPDYTLFKAIRDGRLQAVVAVERASDGWRPLSLDACSELIDYYLHHPGGAQ